MGRENPHGKVQITWLGHAAFRVTSCKGVVIAIDPWLTENPKTPEGCRDFDRLDAILITHGHSDHLGDTLALAAKHRPTIVCNWEISVWLEAHGVKNVVGMNKGGTVRVAGLPVTMTHADHSGGILEDGKIVNGGEPAGYVIGFESGLRLYHAGDTNLFGDMSLIAKLHSPDVALLPIGGHYTMGPREAAMACQLLGAPIVIPMHFGTFPILAGTPAELKAATQTISSLTVVELAPGESYEG